MAEIKLNESDLQQVRDLLSKMRFESPRITSRAINHGLKQGEMAAVDGVYQKAALTKKKIREQVKIYRVRASGNSHTGKVEMSGEPRNLLDYGAKVTNNGVTFRIWRAGKRERYRHAFAWTLLKQRYSGILEVNIDHPRYKAMYEFGPITQEEYIRKMPLRRKTGPSVPVIYMNTPGLAERAEATAAEKMLEELNRQMALVDRRLAKKAGL